MKVHLVNPSNLSFGVAIITPRWMFVLATTATPESWGDPRLTDETLEPLDPVCIERGDVVGIGIQTANAFRGYEICGRVRSPTAADVRADVEAVSADVRQHRARRRQRAGIAGKQLGPLDRETGTTSVRGRPDARPRGPCPAAPCQSACYRSTTHAP